MLAGTTPFKAETYKDVIENNKNCTVNYQHDNLKDVSPECIECLKHILDSNPE